MRATARCCRGCAEPLFGPKDWGLDVSEHRVHFFQALLSSCLMEGPKVVAPLSTLVLLHAKGGFREHGRG